MPFPQDSDAARLLSQAEHMESADHILPQQHGFAGYNNVNGRAPKITPAALREHFHLPLTDVAKKFNMCTTAFKKACRKQGIMQWPHRTLRSLEKKIATLMAETKFTKETDAISAQVRKLQAKQEAILSGKAVLGSDDDIFCVASPSDDSSGTASVHSVSFARSPPFSRLEQSLPLLPRI